MGDRENSKENPILVKIEEDEYIKEKKSSQYIGVTHDENMNRSIWRVRRWSKNEHRMVHNGSYRNEETAAHASDTLARKLMAKGELGHKINFPNDNIEVHSETYLQNKKYPIGVFFNTKTRTWVVQRWSRTEKKLFHNGSYRDEQTAVHASDTLARQLMAKGEQNLKLNFPDEITEVHLERKKNSKYIGVYYTQDRAKWRAKRWSKKENKFVDNGYHKDEETAAHASDTLAKKLMENCKQNLKLNFPDDSTEVHKRTKLSKYFGVSYNEKTKRWVAQRYSKTAKGPFNNGTHKDEETAAHASDTLARKLMENGEQNLILNFPNDKTEVHSRHRPNKRKRPLDFENSQTNENLSRNSKKKKNEKHAKYLVF